MKYVIYLDSFFMINFAMDFISLFILRKMNCSKNGRARAMAAAAFGGLYACLYMIMPFGNGIIRLPFHYVIAVSVMVLIAFGYGNKKRFIHNIVLLYIITFLSGGISNFLYFSAGIKNMPVIMLITAFAGTFASGVYERKKSILKECFEVKVEHHGRSIRLLALADTGNSLTEPYFGRPVSILEHEEVLKIMEGDDIHLQKGYVKIPFHSLGKENGMMDGFEVERIYINMPAKVVCREKVVIGVYNGKVSSEENYKMILNPELLKEI